MSTMHETRLAREGAVQDRESRVLGVLNQLELATDTLEKRIGQLVDRLTAVRRQVPRPTRADDGQVGERDVASPLVDRLAQAVTRLQELEARVGDVLGEVEL